MVDEKANDVAKDGKTIGEVIYRWPWSVPRGYSEHTIACFVTSLHFLATCAIDVLGL